MQRKRKLLENRNVAAWVLMISILAVHVLEETVSGFLPFYNQLVLDMRGRLGFFPMPTFTFGAWLGGLVIFIILCFLLTPVVNRGGRLIRILTIVLGIIMIGNALGHMLGSVYAGRLLPGFWSCPILLPSAVYVVSRGVRGGGWR
jgi:hypothetical protein